MALRRPPTRIELKADDIEEYDEVRELEVLKKNGET